MYPADDIDESGSIQEIENEYSGLFISRNVHHFSLYRGKTAQKNFAEVSQNFAEVS